MRRTSRAHATDCSNGALAATCARTDPSEASRAARVLSDCPAGNSRNGDEVCPGLCGIFRTCGTAGKAQVVLVHYADLEGDLEAEMWRLAAVLEIEGRKDVACPGQCRPSSST